MTYTHHGARWDEEVLARTLYGEARGEEEPGLRAICEVVLNRAADTRWPDKIAAVCLQTKQFSCWNRNDPNFRRLVNIEFPDATFMRCMAVAGDMIRARREDRLLDETGGANHYLASWLMKSPRRPRWADPQMATCVIGRHTFLRI